MSKITFLMSHTPIPRTIKRMNLALKAMDVHLIYWDRMLNNELSFSLNNKIKFSNIKIKAPQGKPLKRLFLLPLFNYKAMRILKSINPEVIHVFNFDMLFLAVSYKKKYKKQLKIIYEIGDLPKISFREDFISNLFSKTEKRLLTDVDKLIITSDKFYEVYYSKIISFEKKLYLPNVPSQRILENFDFGKSNEDKKLNIGFIGAIRYFDELKILCDCVKDSNKYKAKFSGIGIDYEKLLQYSADNENVLVTGGYDYADISKLYSDIDITYSVYNVELKNVQYALPNRLYEAILFEKPLIVSKGTYLSEIVKELEIGYVIENSCQALEECLTNISLDLDEFYRKKKNCRRIKANYYLEKYEKILLEVYMGERK